jgi:hypothetical protein
MTNVKTTTMPVNANTTLRTMPFLLTNSSTGYFPELLGVQIATLSYATKALFLGDITIDAQGVTVNSQADKASFAEYANISNIVSWGDVLTGIEEMSHNVTAGLLSAEIGLGNMSAECSVDLSSLVYQYNSWALWVPYGVSIYYYLFSILV